MLKALLVDNDEPNLSLLSYQLQKTKEFEAISEYSLPTEALKMIPILQPDVIFLEIELSGMSGIVLAEKLRNMKIDTPIIFVTAHKKYAYDAFRVDAFNYLLKPFSMNEFQKVISKLKKTTVITDNLITSSNNRKDLYPIIRCFGKFEVINSNGTIVKWSSKKTQELLAYFILHKEQVIDKWIIGEALWPDYNDKHVNSDFHTTLFRLRKILEKEGIDFQVGSQKGKKHGYIYEPTRIECDVFQLNDFIAQNLKVNSNTIHEFEKIKQLFRGELFSNILSIWCISEKEKYLHAMLEILEEMGTYYIQNNEYDSAYDICLQSLALDYSCEMTHQRMLMVLFLKKDKKGLMNHFKKYKGFLKRDMDTEPDLVTTNLYKQYLKTI